MYLHVKTLLNLVVEAEWQTALEEVQASAARVPDGGESHVPPRREEDT